jgi:hypothetical protein
MSRDALHDELRAAAASVEWPVTPDLAARLELGAEEREQPRAWPRLTLGKDPAARPWGTLRVATAVIVALLIAVAAVPPARSAVLDLLGLTGGEKITRVPNAAPQVGAERFELGWPVSLAAARSAVDFPVRVPSLLGAPATVRLARTIPGGMVSLVYGRDAVLSQFRGGATPYIQKFAGAGTRVQRVDVGGARGYFISGAPPIVLFQDRNGRVVEGRPLLSRGSVLIWDAGGIAHRLELRGSSLALALVIARSLR